MSLGQIFVLTDEERDLIPEILVVVILNSVADALSLADIDRGLSCFRVCSRKEVDSGFVRFLSSEHALELGSGSETAFPVQFDSSAVRSRFGSP